MTDTDRQAWKQVNPNADLLHAHLRGKYGRVCENQNDLRDGYVRIWFPAFPGETYELGEECLLHKAAVECTCVDLKWVGDKPIHEPRCEAVTYWTCRGTHLPAMTGIPIRPRRGNRRMIR